MTAFGFCVVAALSSQTSCRPCTRSSRIGKSRRINRASSGLLAVPRSGITSGRNSNCEAGGTVVLVDALAGRAVSADGIAVLGIEVRSACVGIAVGTGDGRMGMPGGDCTPGTPEKENNSLNDGSDATALG